MSKANTLGVLPIAGQNNPKKLLDVLFIHGLGGDAFSTWQLNDDEKYFWPKALNKDLPNTAIWTIGYGATATSWIEDVMPMEDRVENLLNQLTLKKIGQKPFFLITHSMGGLIAKYLLTQAAQSNDKKYQQFATQCVGIVFLAVPHNGSGWSNILNYARVLVRGNKIVAQISKDNSALGQLDKNFGQLCKRQEFDCYGFYETKEVRLKKKLLGMPLLSKGIKVVSESSAKSTFLTKPAVPLDDDHLSICKISSKEDLLYLNIIDILKDSLSRIGDKISDYPKSLVENSHLLWIQQTRSKLQANTNLSNNIAHVFNLSNQNPDIIHAIQKIDSNLSHEISHHHWLKGRSIKIDMTDPEQSGERQLRAALLRIMLGRENIKNALHGQIFHSDIINNRSFLSYVVTGNKNACPFDFPAQLQQRLQYEDINHSLKVIPFYFNIDVKPEYNAFDTIEIALSQGILHASNDIAEIFHKAVTKYDESCISLNWLLKVSQENQHLLNEWLIEWRGIQCHWFANKVPDQTVLLSAVCIQIEQDDNNQALAQKTQEQANEILEETESCQMEAIYIEDALGTLKAQEINSFLRKTPYWQKQLKLDQNNIDLKDYANWVYKQEKGKFDPSVRIIWQQSQDNYQKYLESS